VLWRYYSTQLHPFTSLGIHGKSSTLPQLCSAWYFHLLTIAGENSMDFQEQKRRGEKVIEAFAEAFSLEFAVAFITVLFLAAVRFFFPGASSQQLLWSVLVFQLCILTLIFYRRKDLE
jgi:hypothetical protein